MDQNESDSSSHASPEPVSKKQELAEKLENQLKSDKTELFKKFKNKNKKFKEQLKTMEQIRREKCQSQAKKRETVLSRRLQRDQKLENYSYNHGYKAHIKDLLNQSHSYSYADNRQKWIEDQKIKQRKLQQQIMKE